MQENKPTSVLQDAAGKMAYTLTNDYLFRAVLQQSNNTLRNLVCSLLHLSPDKIQSVEITNPIELGKRIDAKTFLLDIKLLLNNDTCINIEMQVLNLGNWPERSLGYLCRSFDSLNRGENYLDAKAVIQISFLDFTLFPQEPALYSKYMFTNVKTHTIYSDKLQLFVVDLTKIDHATDEDRFYGLHQWAKFFKATTWEEIKMLVEENKDLAEAAETAYKLSTDETIRQQCEAREDYYLYEQYRQKKFTQAEQMLARAEQKLANAEQKLTNTEQKLTNTEQKLTNAEQKLTHAEQEALEYKQAYEELLKKFSAGITDLQ